MKVAIKQVVMAAALLLFVAEPMAFGQNSSTPPRPADISGDWTLEFGSCKGSISVSPPLNSGGNNWNGIWTGQCGSDALQVQYIISEKSREYLGSFIEVYNFRGSGSFSDGIVVTENYNLNWSTGRQTLAGSGFIAIGSAPKRSVSFFMHK